ncbi:MAG: DedA family protein [candidate division Zixibacteria bacterium]|nr:DedA family protein [candidate division Zixibacteria bacterium]
MSESIAHINQYLDYLFVYGPFWVYLVLFTACFIENIFPPFPGDSFIFAAGGLVAIARLHPIVTYLVVISGGMCSVMVLYYLGRKYGHDYFVRKNFKYFSAADIAGVEAKLEKYGAAILIFSRFVVGFRSALAIGAGIGRYQSIRMFVYSLISYLVFAGLLMYIAYKLVENVEVIDYYFTTYNRVVWPLLGAALIVYIWHRYRKFRKTRVK